MASPSFPSTAYSSPPTSLLRSEIISSRSRDSWEILKGLLMVVLPCIFAQCFKFKYYYDESPV